MIIKEIIKFVEYIGIAVPSLIGISIGMWLYFWEYYIIKEQDHYDHIIVKEL